MFKKKAFFLVLEGIEGTGKSYHSKKIIKFLNKKRIKTKSIREPGGCESAEKIRNLILNGKTNKFDKFTDTLLYLAARNENFIKNIKINLLKKQVIVCDRFTDSTIAYQSYGLGVNKLLIEKINNNILNNIKPDLVLYLFTDKKIIKKRLNKRRSTNRYDKFSSKFYQKVHNGYISISKGRKNFIKVNTGNNTSLVQRKIFDIIKKRIKLWKKK